VRSKTDYEPA